MASGAIQVVNNNTSNYIYTASNPIQDQPKSECIWVKIADVPVADGDVAVCWDQIGASYHCGLQLKGLGGKWYLRLTDTNSDAVGTHEITLNTWWHIGFTRTTATPRVQRGYVNGVYEMTFNSNTDASPTQEVCFSCTSGRTFTVALSRGRQWTEVLSDSDMLAEYGSSTIVRALNAYRNLPLSAITDLVDTINGYNFTSGGGTLTTVDGPTFAGAIGPFPTFLPGVG